jgi:hypothetical protein
MKPAAFCGIALILLGFLLFTYQGITYTDGEKAADLGALVSGIVLLVVGSNEALTIRP